MCRYGTVSWRKGHGSVKKNAIWNRKESKAIKQKKIHVSCDSHNSQILLTQIREHFQPNQFCFNPIWSAKKTEKQQKMAVWHFYICFIPTLSLFPLKLIFCSVLFLILHPGGHWLSLQMLCSWIQFRFLFFFAFLFSLLNWIRSIWQASQSLQLRRIFLHNISGCLHMADKKFINPVMFVLVIFSPPPLHSTFN